MSRDTLINGRAPVSSVPAPNAFARRFLIRERKKPVKFAVSPPRPTGAEATSMAKASQTTRPSSTTNQGSSQSKGSSKSKLRTATRIADEELNDFEMASTSTTVTSTPKVSLPNGS